MNEEIQWRKQPVELSMCVLYFRTKISRDFQIQLFTPIFSERTQGFETSTQYSVSTRFLTCRRVPPFLYPSTTTASPCFSSRSLSLPIAACTTAHFPLLGCFRKTSFFGSTCLNFTECDGGSTLIDLNLNSNGPDSFASSLLRLRMFISANP